jgi:hypothetical protein
MFLTSSSSSATARNQESALSLGLVLAVLLHLGPVIPRTALVFFLTSTVVLVEGPCNRERSVPFYRSCNTSPWIGSLLLVALVAHDGTLLSAGTVALYPPCTLEGRQ